MDKLTNELIAKVANKLNLEPALLKTVTVVECGNRDGFLPSGRPQILFEGHVMWKYLKIKLDGEGKRTYLYDLAKGIVSASFTLAGAASDIFTIGIVTCKPLIDWSEAMMFG